MTPDEWGILKETAPIENDCQDAHLDEGVALCLMSARETRNGKTLGVFSRVATAGKDDVDGVLTCRE